jgi:hypothetical protein
MTRTAGAAHAQHTDAAGDAIARPHADSHGPTNRGSEPDAYADSNAVTQPNGDDGPDGDAKHNCQSGAVRHADGDRDAGLTFNLAGRE